MKNVFKRLFIKLPLYFLNIVILMTGVIPILYYVVTGKNYLNFDKKIEDRIDSL